MAQQEYSQYDVDDDEYGVVTLVLYYVKLIVAFCVMILTTILWTVVLLLLIPWPYERIKLGNMWGRVTGRLLFLILGNPVKIEGLEHSHNQAVFISNHASVFDVLLIMWLTPIGSVGIAKKEIVWYPLLGQIYWLANHLRIDRSNPSRAIQSMKEAAREVVKNKLSVIIFPEGTRSRTGRLLSFKKGVIHLAVQTRLPIVPVVMIGTHNAWKKGGLCIRPVPMAVKFLPPVKTDDWTLDKIDEHVEFLHDLYVQHLPKSQKPLASEKLK